MADRELIVAGTGHRPEDAEDEGIVRLKARTKLRYPNKLGRITTVIGGMASGFDLWLCDEARLLGLEVWAARPWAGHTPREADRELYDTIIAYASRVVNVYESPDYKGPWQYHKRNEWMVDHADIVMAYLNPEKTTGGTYACVQYAKKVGRPVSNIYLDPPF